MKTRHFVSDALTPDTRTADTRGMVAGGPGLPAAFQWRGKRLEVVRVLRQWRELGDCSHGSGERYLRKHWFELEFADGRVGEVYFERQGRPPNRKQRWWLYTIEAKD